MMWDYRNSMTVLLLLLPGVLSRMGMAMAQADRQTYEDNLSKESVYPTVYDEMPQTSTESTYYGCDSSHRPLEGNKNRFQVYHNDRWWTQSCPENLEWNQVSCRCEYPEGNPANTFCRDYRHSSRSEPGKYEQFVNGAWIVRDCSLVVAGLVWDQTVCQCVWGPRTSGKVTGQGITPCDIMLNMTFDDGVKDKAKGSFVEVGHANSLSTHPLGRDKNKAAYFSGTSASIWFFSNNELGSSLRVEFQFKMDDTPLSRDKYQILLSNGCNVTVPGYTTPSLAVGFRPADQSYLLAFQTVNNKKAITCTSNRGVYDWHTVSLVYEDGVLYLRVDGQPCIISQDFLGVVKSTACPLTIGADPLETQSMYHGYMDNIVIARYCRRYMDVQEDSVDEGTRTRHIDAPRHHQGSRSHDDSIAESPNNNGNASGKQPQSSTSKGLPVAMPFRARVDFNRRKIFKEQRPMQSSRRRRRRGEISKRKEAITPFRSRINTGNCQHFEQEEFAPNLITKGRGAMSNDVNHGNGGILKKIRLNYSHDAGTGARFDVANKAKNSRFIENEEHEERSEIKRRKGNVRGQIQLMVKYPSNIYDKGGNVKRDILSSNDVTIVTGNHYGLISAVVDDEVDNDGNYDDNDDDFHDDDDSVPESRSVTENGEIVGADGYDVVVDSLGNNGKVGRQRGYLGSGENDMYDNYDDDDVDNDDSRDVDLVIKGKTGKETRIRDLREFFDYENDGHGIVNDKGNYIGVGYDRNEVIDAAAAPAAAAAVDDDDDGGDDDFKNDGDNDKIDNSDNNDYNRDEEKTTLRHQIPRIYDVIERNNLGYISRYSAKKSKKLNEENLIRNKRKLEKFKKMPWWKREN